MNLLRPKSIALCAALILLCCLARIAPHLPNFTPLAAVALFAAARFRSRLAAALVPLCAMALSDLIIGGYEWKVMIVVYAALLFPVLLRPLLRGSYKPARLLLAASLSTLVFFLTTNFAVWCFGGWYSSGLSGLSACYIAALPFLKYNLLGDLFWSVTLFAGYELYVLARTSSWLRAKEAVCAHA
jgi:hypothetical protein